MPNPNHNNLQILSVFVLIILFSFLPIVNNQVKAAKSGPIIIDHTSIALFDQIPQNYLDVASTQLKICYGHCSHGSEII